MMSGTLPVMLTGFLGTDQSLGCASVKQRNFEVLQIRRNCETVEPEVRQASGVIHGGNVLEAAERAGIEESDLLDFSSNINPMPLPDLADAISNALKRLHRYPDNRYRRLRGVIAEHYRIPLDNILPGNGSTELIRLYTEMMLRPEDAVLIPIPAYEEYGYNAVLAGAKVEYMQYNELLKKQRAICESYLEGGGIHTLFICNPNNPTGNLMPKSAIIEILDVCAKHNANLVIDEAFIELSDPKESMIHEAVEHGNLLVLRSLTKCYAIPGARMGFAVANGNLAAKLNAARMPWSVNVFAEEMTVLLLRDKTYMKHSREYIKKERERLQKDLEHIKGLVVHPGAANYLLINIKGTGITSSMLRNKLLKERILVRDCTSFHGLGEDYIRVAVKGHEDNVRLVDVLKKVIKGC